MPADKQCAYCEQAITDNAYTYKWFPDKRQMLPVHNYHLNAKRQSYKYKEDSTDGGQTQIPPTVD